MSINPQDSQKILLGFILFLIISIIWSSLFIIKNPYTYPTNFWLNFMMGFIFYIVVLMIDSTIAKLQLINTFQFIIIVLTTLLNAILVANTYRKFVTIPPHLITVIISLNGFASAHVVNYMLSFNVNKLKNSSPLQTYPQTTTRMTPPPQTTMMQTTMPPTTVMQTTMPPTTMMSTTMSPTTMMSTTRPLPGVPQLRSLNMDMYDFGAFDLAEERADGADNEYFRDYAAQYRDEEELNSGDDYVEDDYVEDDYVEDDYIEDDYIEDDYAEDDYAEDDYAEDDYIEDY